MAQPTPIFVGLDVHKDSIAVARGQRHGADPPVFLSARSVRAKPSSSTDRDGLSRPLELTDHRREEVSSP